MKIDSVKLHHLRMQLRHPFETSFGRIEWRHSLLVEIASEGLLGYGECAADKHPGFSYETVGTAWEIMNSELIPRLFLGEIEDAQSFQESVAGVRGHPMAKAGVEMAIWDLLGKRSQNSLADLLGVKKKSVDVGVSIGIAPSPDELVSIVAGFVEAGYGRVKLKIKPGQDGNFVAAVRQSFPKLRLQVDANSAYSLSTAEALKKIDDLDLLLIEQPLAEDDLWDHHLLQKKLNTPICLDESIISPRHARQAIEMKACRVINIKSGRVGGITSAIAIHDLCLASDIPVWCGGMLETGVGRAANLALAALPGFTLPGDISASERYYFEDISNESFSLNSDSTIDIPGSPGLGITINRSALKQATVKSKIIRE